MVTVTQSSEHLESSRSIWSLLRCLLYCVLWLVSSPVTLHAKHLPCAARTLQEMSHKKHLSRSLVTIATRCICQPSAHDGGDFCSTNVSPPGPNSSKYDHSALLRLGLVRWHGL